MSDISGPLISKWREGSPIPPIQVGIGNESREYGVVRHGFHTDEGRRQYVEKHAYVESEAKRILGMYQEMKEANLPVAQFLKIRKTRNEKGGRSFRIWMQDVTEN